MTHPVYIVDAFATRPFEGNPAAVMLLDNWLPDETLLAIAREHNLSETAFLIPAVDEEVDYRLRWFTPAVEMDLCGHATLASAHVVRELAIEQGGSPPSRVVFTTRSGRLAVTADDATGRLSLDFPARPPSPVADSAVIERVAEALGDRPDTVLASRDLVAVFGSRDRVAALKPDFRAVAALGVHAVIATAPGSPDERDGAVFVSRFFAPEVGVDEDPVTGSAHATLVPYWSDRLGAPEVVGRQISPRGGTLWCRYRASDERVDLAGHAVTYLKGEVSLGTPIAGRSA